MIFDMVFEGGGAKGFAFVGALDQFLGRGHAADRVLGTSAGSIAATLVAAGYSMPELLGAPAAFEEDLFEAGGLSTLLRRLDIPYVPAGVEAALRARFLRFLVHKPPGNNLFSLIELGGWFSADAFLEWMESRLNDGELNGRPRNFGGMTLREFHAATGKDLSLVATDTSEHLMLVLNHRTAPDVPVRWAARMSMSIPLLWQEVVWRADWGEYAGRDITGHSIVDGGVVSNFPLALFVSSNKEVMALMGEKRSSHVLGLLIDEKMEVPGVPVSTPAGPGGVRLGELKTVQRLEALVDTLLESHDKSVIEAFEDRVVRLPAAGYGTTEFEMTEQRRELLIEAGRAAMKVYLDKMEPRLRAFEERALAPAGVAFGIDGEAPQQASDPAVDRLADRILSSNGLLGK
jgi:predicted acylesterase/phospholipase RssA